MEETCSHYGEKEVTFKYDGCENKDPTGLKFQVTDVRKPLLAVRRLVEKGNKVVLAGDDEESYIMNKATVPVIRSRWVARDLKDPKEKDREDLFSATPPLEMMRFIMSRQATHRKDGRERKSMYLNTKKAHVIPLYEQDVYVELPGEAEVEDDECGKLIHWLYGCRPAAQAWE